MNNFFDSLIYDEKVFDFPKPNNNLLRRIKMGETYFYITIYFDLDSETIKFNIEKVMVINFPFSQFDERVVNLCLINLEGINLPLYNLVIDTSNIPNKGQKKDVILISNYQIFCKNKQAAHRFIKETIIEHMNIRGIVNKTYKDKSRNNILKEYKEAIRELKLL